MINIYSNIMGRPQRSRNIKLPPVKPTKSKFSYLKLPSIMLASAGVFVCLNTPSDKSNLAEKSNDMSLTLDKDPNLNSDDAIAPDFSSKDKTQPSKKKSDSAKTPRIGIGIEQLSGRAKKVGVRVDRENQPDNMLLGNEVTLFFDGCEKKNIDVEREKWFKANNVSALYEYHKGLKRKLSGEFICEPDALRLSPDFKPKLPIDLPVRPKPLTHEEVADRIADSWANTFNIDNSDGSFTDFVEKLYDVTKELNVTKPNRDYNPIYPKLEDQVVDELLGAFANESKFNPEATSADGLYHGIFQFSDVGMKDLKNKGTSLPIISMDDFEKLSRVEQLDYMLEAGKVSKKYYSKLGDEPMSAKQVYAMWKFPAAGNPNSKIKYGKKVHIGSVVQEEKACVIAKKQATRGEINFKNK